MLKDVIGLLHRPKRNMRQKDITPLDREGQEKQGLAEFYKKLGKYDLY